MKFGPRYEVQVRHKEWGWSSAGNWPARTKAEGLKSLRQCAEGIHGNGSIHDYRLVRLVAITIKRIPAARQRYEAARKFWRSGP
jgi:hypothetical protein